MRNGNPSSSFMVQDDLISQSSLGNSRAKSMFTVQDDLISQSSFGNFSKNGNNKRGALKGVNAKNNNNNNKNTYTNIYTKKQEKQPQLKKSKLLPITSQSFIVQDDLISQSSTGNTKIKGLNKIKPAPKLNNYQNKTQSNDKDHQFAVQDDLISQSSLGNTRLTAFHGLNDKPFSKKVQPNNNDKIIKKIRQKAQQDAFKQLNDQTYNPFQHKLNQGYVNSQMDLYTKQKMRQIQMIKQKQQAMLNSNKNYTIVFHQEKKNNNKLFQIAAKNNLVSIDQNPTLEDYYNQKFKKDKNYI